MFSARNSSSLSECNSSSLSEHNNNSLSECNGSSLSQQNNNRLSVHNNNSLSVHNSNSLPIILLSLSLRRAFSLSLSLSEPLLDWHMPVFTGKCFPSTGKKYSCWDQVPAETERFVRLARDHTLYPGS